MRLIKLGKINRKTIIGIVVVLAVLIGGYAATTFIINKRFASIATEKIEPLATFNSTGNATANSTNVGANATTSNTNATGPADSNNPFAGFANNTKSVAGFNSDPDAVSVSDESKKPTTFSTNSTEKSASSAPPVASESVLSGPSFISLSSLTALRSQLDALDVQVKIADKQKRLHELSMAMYPVPAITQKTVKQKKRKAFVYPRIQTVQAGSSAGHGRVTSITPSTVLVRYNGKNVSLKFKE